MNDLGSRRRIAPAALLFALAGACAAPSGSSSTPAAAVLAHERQSLASAGRIPAWPATTLDPEAFVREPLADDEPTQSGASPQPGAAQGAPAQAPGGEPAAAPKTPDVDIPIAIVAGEPIDARAFLTRLWMRANDVSRETLDRLVVENLALIEAERQEIAVSPTRVDERSEAAWKALGESLERQGKGVSIAEHLRRELGVDSEFYRRQLRREAILQMLAERVVRAWAFGRPRCDVRLVDLADKAALDAFTAGLAAGKDFDTLAKELHRFREKEPDGARITLIKNDNAELSRLAFHTAEGQIAGPIETEPGRHLMMRVERFHEPLTGSWKEIGPAIEKSLAETPVDDLEYVQWRAEMVKSYSVDLEPFFRLIGVSH